MYFPSEDEKKRLLRGLLPKARKLDIPDELRGWNWHRGPLEPIYDVKIALYEVAGKYCSSGRDVYLRRVLGVKTKPNKAMIAGAFFHEVVASVMVDAKRLIYTKGVRNYKDILDELRKPVQLKLDRKAGHLAPQEIEEIEHKAEIIRSFEVTRVCSRIQDLLAQQPFIAEDSLASLAIPVIVEQRLDGGFLGLSHNLSADALVFSEPMIVDLKFGRPEKFHQLSTTGYALVMEAIYEFPVNLGCIVYAEFQDDRLVLNRVFHLIDAELRQWFIDERDEKMRIVYEEIDPGFAESCYSECPYYKTCRGSQKD